MVNDSGKKQVLTPPGASLNVTARDAAAAGDLIASAKSLLSQLEVPTEAVGAAMRPARAGGAPVVLDPAGELWLPHLNDAGQPQAFESFMEGFLTRQKDGTYAEFGRPTGLTVGKDGALLVGDVTHGVIYRITYQGGDQQASR